MWVMYLTSLYSHCVPVKRRVAIWAPHLRAPANLENHGPATGARFCIFFEKRDRLHIVWITCVFITILDLVTILANGILTNLTLPPSR